MVKEHLQSHQTWLPHSTQLGTVLVGRYITVAYWESKRFFMPWVSGFGKGR